MLQAQSQKFVLKLEINSGFFCAEVNRHMISTWTELLKFLQTKLLCLYFSSIETSLIWFHFSIWTRGKQKSQGFTLDKKGVSVTKY